MRDMSRSSTRVLIRLFSSSSSSRAKASEKLTADEIKAAISRKDGKLRLTQIPGPETTDPRQSYEWLCVKDIEMPYHVMYDLLQQKDFGLQRRPRFASAKSRVSGFNLFIREFSQSRAKTAGKERDGVMAMRSLLQEASSAWKQMPDEQKEEYKRRAAQLPVDGKDGDHVLKSLRVTRH